MNKKIGLILLAIVVTIGIGLGAALASPDHAPEQHVFLRAHLADTGCPYVTLANDAPQMALWWEAGDYEGHPYPLTHHFELNGVYPGFGQSIAPCDKPSYVLYFLRNEDTKEESKIGAIDVIVSADWVKYQPYDAILGNIQSDVYQRIDDMGAQEGLAPDVIAAMKAAFDRGCIETGDALAPSLSVGENPLAWGCYGITLRVPDVDEGASATIDISITPPPEGELTESGPHFLDSTDIDN